MKECSICKIDISHKKSNNSSKCEKCSRRLNENSLNKIKARTKNIKSVKQEILVAYNSCCAICGWKTEKNFYQNKYLHQRGCEIHHINPVCNGGKDVFENCILLCPNHHKEADLGIISKSVLLSYILKDKEEVIEHKKLERMSKGMELLDGLF
jgi:predicted restriction endonuclease